MAYTGDQFFDMACCLEFIGKYRGPKEALTKHLIASAVGVTVTTAEHWLVVLLRLRLVTKHELPSDRRTKYYVVNFKWEDLASRDQVHHEPK